VGLVGQVGDTHTTEIPVFGRRDPDARGYFGEYGGRFVPETLVAPIEELTAGYLAAREDARFQQELSLLLSTGTWLGPGGARTASVVYSLLGLASLGAAYALAHVGTCILAARPLVQRTSESQRQWGAAKANGCLHSHM